MPTCLWPRSLMLRPRSGPAQWIFHEEYGINPRLPVMEYTESFGNLCQRVVIPPGKTKLHAACTADTADTVDVDLNSAFIVPQNLPEGVLHFLLASRYCPSDQLAKLATEIVAGAPLGYGQVEAIRGWMQTRIEYKYGTSTAATTAVDTAQGGAGVCRDFAHLGIALCRALNIPARMVVGCMQGAESAGHSCVVRGLGGRTLVCLRRHATADRRQPHRHRLRTRCDGCGVRHAVRSAAVERLSVSVVAAQ